MAHSSVAAGSRHSGRGTPGGGSVEPNDYGSGHITPDLHAQSYAWNSGNPDHLEVVYVVAVTGFQNIVEASDLFLTLRARWELIHPLGVMHVLNARRRSLRIVMSRAQRCSRPAAEDMVMGVIPLGDATRRPVHIPRVTLAIIVENFVVFGLELFGGQPFVTKWSMIPAQITSGQHLITILTGMFMHAGWSHIIGNMIYLWAFGPEIEDSMGPRRYLCFYLTGGLAATLAQVLGNPHSTIPNLGASGAIAAVMGAFLVTYPRDRIRTVLFVFIFSRVRYVPSALLIGIWFLSQLVNAGAVAHVETGGVAYLAHIGGFMWGAVTARLFEDRRRLGSASWAAA
jgi:membrane associated rhomboid family serine protease